MAARLTQLKTQRTAASQSVEALARKSGLTVKRILQIEGLGPITAANPFPSQDHADPDEEKRLEVALSQSAGALR